ncbi:MAG: 30S ribosomal protein S17 [Candidatus Beckwithbacteria bacterium]
MKQLKATVINTKMAQTAVVQVTRRWTHPLYQKTLTKKKKFLCQNQLELKAGDKVVIQPCRPQSKLKKWQVIKKI